MKVTAYGPNHDAVADLLTAYDMRGNGLELRRDVYAGGLAMFALYIGGQPARLSGTLPPLWGLMVAGLNADGIGGIEIVSRAPRQRMKRTRTAWAPEWDMISEPTTVGAVGSGIDDAERRRSAEEERESLSAYADRYDRAAETVCDILPDYKVTIGSLLPELFTSEPVQAVPFKAAEWEPRVIDRGENRASFGCRIPGMAF